MISGICVPLSIHSTVGGDCMLFSFTNTIPTGGRKGREEKRGEGGRQGAREVWKRYSMAVGREANIVTCKILYITKT